VFFAANCDIVAERNRLGGTHLATHMSVQAPRSVLVVEDDVEERELLGDYLRKHHFTVRCAPNGAEAIAILENGMTPNVILSDLLMPGVLGTSVVEYVRSNDKLRGVTIAILTGSPDLAPDGCRVFAKPVKLAAVIDYINDPQRT
jgi:CheY-like chemotaxis protein